MTNDLNETLAVRLRLKELKAIIDATDTPGNILLKAAHIFGSSPYIVSSKVIVAAREVDGHIRECHAGTLLSGGAGFVLFDLNQARRTPMVLLRAGENFVFRSLSSETFSWSGKLTGANLYFDRDRDTYVYYDIPDCVNQVRAWLERYVGTEFSV